MENSISIVAAKSLNNVIGKDNYLPWSLSKDLKRFKRLTHGHHIIMGRKTFESIGKALPGRKNVVISTTLDRNDYPNQDIEIYNELHEPLFFINKIRQDKVFIIGGERIFKESLPFINKMYLTEVQAEIDGNVFFPFIPGLNDRDRWKLIEHSKHYQDEKHDYNFDFITLDRTDNDDFVKL